MRSRIALIAVLLTAVGAGSAQAAALRICFRFDAQDVTKVRLYIGPTVAADNLLAGPGVVISSPECSDISIPTAAVRGQSLLYTLKSVNSLGEEGPASNAITFRAPLVPGAPTAVSVGVALP